jgi:hypothetical protein
LRRILTEVAPELTDRLDKPVTKLRTTVVRDDGTVALTGTAVCYTMMLTTGHPQDAPARPKAF